MSKAEEICSNVARSIETFVKGIEDRASRGQLVRLQEILMFLDAQYVELKKAEEKDVEDK